MSRKIRNTRNWGNFYVRARRPSHCYELNRCAERTYDFEAFFVDSSPSYNKEPLIATVALIIFHDLFNRLSRAVVLFLRAVSGSLGQSRAVFSRTHFKGYQTNEVLILNKLRQHDLAASEYLRIF